MDSIESETNDGEQAMNTEVEINYPETGEQTQITPKIKEIAKGIKGEGIIAVMNVDAYMQSMRMVEGSQGPTFIKTAEEIIDRGEYDGCNEAGVVRATLLRTKGISVTFVQTFNKKAVASYSTDNRSLNGHVYLEANLGTAEDPDRKYIDSTSGEISENLPEDKVIAAKGLDSWDIGLKNGFEDLEELMIKTKQEYSR